MGAFTVRLRSLQTSRANNSRIHRVKNVEFLGYCFYMNTNIESDFQICIRVPLKNLESFFFEVIKDFSR